MPHFEVASGKVCNRQDASGDLDLGDISSLMHPVRQATTE